jgi:hypothetical protein
MKPILLPAALAALSTAAAAQVTEIPAMTVDSSLIDMDALAAGPTTVAALNAAGTNGGAQLLDIVLTPSAAAQGLYNTNTTNASNQPNRALARSATNTLVLINPLATFNAFDAQILLEQPSVEFGIGIGDWLEGMVLDFYRGGAQVGSIVTSDYATANAKFFRSGVPFDEVRVRATRPEGNWVIPELYLEKIITSWVPFGSGCAGTNGVPTLELVGEPLLGATFQLDVVNLPAAGGAFLMALGFSDTNSAFGPLPFDMGQLGAPGCSILCDIVNATLLLHTGGTGHYSLPIPNAQILLAVQFFQQAYVADATVNPLGVTTSNAGRAVIEQ